MPFHDVFRNTPQIVLWYSRKEIEQKFEVNTKVVHENTYFHLIAARSRFESFAKLDSKRASFPPAEMRTLEVVAGRSE